MRKLNLGCGEFPKEDYVNVDFESLREPDIRHNLNQFPYPFKENEFDLIEASHVLEHLENPFKVMKELHRIAAPNAKIIIKAPHFSRGFTHSDHKRGFDVGFSFYFKPSFPGYVGFEFVLEQLKLTWWAQPYLKKVVLSKHVCAAGAFLNVIFNFFANLSPNFCSRIWCFWVGGFEEIEYCFRVKK